MTLRSQAHLFFTSMMRVSEAFLTRYAFPQSAGKTVSQPQRLRSCVDRSAESYQQVHNIASHVCSLQTQDPGAELMQFAATSGNVVTSTHAEPRLVQWIRVRADARWKTTAPESTSMSTKSPSRTLIDPTEKISSFAPENSKSLHTRCQGRSSFQSRQPWWLPG